MSDQVVSAMEVDVQQTPAASVEDKKEDKPPEADSSFSSDIMDKSIDRSTMSQSESHSDSSESSQEMTASSTVEQSISNQAQSGGISRQDCVTVIDSVDAGNSAVGKSGKDATLEMKTEILSPEPPKQQQQQQPSQPLQQPPQPPALTTPQPNRQQQTIKEEASGNEASPQTHVSSATNSAIIVKKTSPEFKVDVAHSALGTQESKPVMAPLPSTAPTTSTAAEAHPDTHPSHGLSNATAATSSITPSTTTSGPASQESVASAHTTVSTPGGDSSSADGQRTAGPNEPSTSAAAKAGADGGDVMADKASLRAVLQFLRKNNLKEAEETLLKEAKLESGLDALLHTEAAEENTTSRDIKSVTAVSTKEESNARQQEAEAASAAAAAAVAALAQYQSDAEVNVYVRQYAALSHFIETSLDSYRFEMALVAYPLFVHMYLELVFNGHEDDAKRLYRRFSGDHLELYPEDIKTLGTLTTKNHMVKSPFMEHFKTGKFVIRMSRDTYQGLRRHLQDQQLTKILEIVQEHLYIDVYDGAPRNEVSTGVGSKT